MHQNKYDVIYILEPSASAEEMTVVSSKIEQVVADAKGTVLKKDDWGKRRLAYSVQKHREGRYVFFHVMIGPEAVAEISRNLHLLEKVIKYTIVKDEISHLKPRPAPVRKSAPEGAVRGTGGSYRTHAPVRRGPESPSPKAPEGTAPKAPEAAAPKEPEAAAAPAEPPATPTTPSN